MPAGVVRTESDEKMWNRAKTAASQSYKQKDKAYWPTVNHIYQQMKRSHKRNLKKMRKAPIGAALHHGPSSLN